MIRFGEIDEDTGREVTYNSITGERVVLPINCHMEGNYISCTSEFSFDSIITDISNTFNSMISSITSLFK